MTCSCKTTLYLNTFLHPDFHLTDSNSQVTFSTCHIRVILYSCYIMRYYNFYGDNKNEILKKNFDETLSEKKSFAKSQKQNFIFL